MEYSKNDFVDYYFKFKELVLLHRKLNFGSNPHIPSVFSESIVKNLAGYSNWENKDFDAKTENSLGVEIKATGTENGTTTINIEKLTKSEFSHIEWIYMNFSTDEFTIKIIEKDALSEFVQSEANKKERPSITLNQYEYSSMLKYKFKKEHDIEQIN